MRLLLPCLILTACGFQAVGAESTTSGGVDAFVAQDGGGDPTVDAVVAVDAATVAQLTPTTFMERLIRLECEQAFTCKPQYMTMSPSFAVAWGTDLNDCVVTDRDYLQAPQIEAAVVGGTITFDPALAASCLAAPGIPTSCATLFNDNYEWSALCYAALLGHIVDGGGCTTDWQCALGSVCRAGTCMH